MVLSKNEKMMQNAKFIFGIDNPYSIFIAQMCQNLSKTQNLAKNSEYNNKILV
jgi:hypothetical protein